MSTQPVHAPDQPELVILKGAIENTNEAFVTIDRNHIVLIFNKAAEEMFGYSREEVIGKNLKIILSPDCAPDHQRAVERYIHTGEAKVIGHETEFMITRKDGIRFPVTISFSVSTIGGNHYFTGIVRDQRETKALQDRINQAERLAMVGQLVAEISHEIRNPLMLIGGFARQIMTNTQGEADLRKLRIICQEVSRLENLLTELRELYRPTRLSLSRFDLNELLTELTSLVTEDCRSRDIDLVLNTHPDSLVIEGDKDKVKQVLLNLVKNAFEAVETGGRVHVESRNTDDGVHVLVEDTGTGIPTDVLEHIFDPFFTTKKHGTGLGLSVSKRIIEDHGGRVSVSSMEGEGTHIEILLPKSPSGPAPATEAPAASIPAPPSLQQGE